MGTRRNGTSNCLAVTGHRPDRLGGYSEDARLMLDRFAYLQLLAYDVDTAVIVGCALGWDTSIGYAALSQGHRLTCAVPFEGFDCKWPRESRVRLNKMLDSSSSVHVVCSRAQVSDLGYARCLNVRNEYMVDSCTELLALYSGSTGGTANAVDYAQVHGVKIKNVWHTWMRYSSRHIEEHKGVNWNGRSEFVVNRRQ